MKQQQWKAGLIVALLVAVAGSVALAGATAGSSPAKKSAPPAKKPAAPAKEPAKAAGAPAASEHVELFFPPLMKFLHKPTPWWNMGLDFRFRIEYGENWQSLNDSHDPANRDVNHEYEYERYRTRWWTKWLLGDDITLNTRLTWEFRTWDEPEYKTWYSYTRPGDTNPNLRETNPDEALLDWFNINWRNVFGLPVNATIGRQDMMFGVGWLIMDGTPLDGSRTLYFDAGRFTLNLTDAKTTLDLIYVDQSAKSDRWLKPICDQDRAVIEQDQHGAIAYLTNKSIDKMQLEGFFIYLNDNPIDGHVSNIPQSFEPRWSTKAEIFTYGAAIAGTPEEHWRYRAEGALQGGHRQNEYTGASQGINNAYGALATLEYLFKDPLNSATHVTYEYASGDDPGTAGRNEQFDLLWGEWPRWSELLIYTSTLETEPAALTNLHRFNIGHKFNVTKLWTITLDYHAIWADQPGSTLKPGATGLNVANRTKFHEGERFRGSLFTGWAKFKISDQLYGHLLGEYFIPGTYYQGPTNDDAFFLRLNIEYVF
jgi:hypothetical protein